MLGGGSIGTRPVCPLAADRGPLAVSTLDHDGKRRTDRGGKRSHRRRRAGRRAVDDADEAHHVEATVAQIAALASAGCEVVRCAVPKIEDAKALRQIVRFSPIPVIADIHFNASLALRAIDAGVAAVRINPGNIGLRRWSRRQRREEGRHRDADRANSGSPPAHLHKLARQDQAEALVAAALEEVELLENALP